MSLGSRKTVNVYNRRGDADGDDDGDGDGDRIGDRVVVVMVMVMVMACSTFAEGGSLE